MAVSKMTGAENVARVLRQISPGLQVPINQASRNAMRPLLAATKAALKANGNVKTGGLLRALTIRKKSGTPRGTTETQVGPSKSNPDYRLGHLIEFGTAPHAEGKHMHPGSRAFPFMRPAFEATKDQVVQKFAEEIGPAIEKRAADLAAKGKI